MRQGRRTISLRRGREASGHRGLGRFLGALPEAQRQAIVLRYYLHLTEQQIADVAGVAPGTVKSRISRAMTALAASPGLLALREGQS